MIWETPPTEPAIGDATSVDGSEAPRRSDRRAWAAAGVVAALAVIGLVWLWPSGTDDDPLTDDSPDDQPVTTLGTLPPSDDETDPGGDDGPREDDDGSSEDGGRDDETTDGAVDEQLTTSIETGSDGRGGTDRTSVPQSSVLELPDELPIFEQPFEIVMTTSSGVGTLSLPSGTLRTSPVDLGGTAQQIMVAPDSALVHNFRSAAIVGRDGTVTPVASIGDADINSVGWSAIEGATQFLLLSWSDLGVPDLTAVDASGAARSVGSLTTFPTYTGRGGGQLVNDAGGVYRLAPDGTASLVARGSMLGFGSNRILLRTCDENYECVLSTLDIDTGERIEFAATPDFELPSRLLWANDAVVSPDGTAVVITTQRPDEVQPSALVLDNDGSTQVIDGDGDPRWPSPVSWVPDSSGFVQVQSIGAGGTSTVQYVRRDGTIVSIDGLPTGITALGVRTVDAELADVEVGGLGATAPVDVATALVGVDLGVAVHIDFATGTVTSWATPNLRANPDLFVADGAVIGTSADGTESLRSTFTSVRGQRIQGGNVLGGPRFRGPEGELMWRPDAEATTFELVAIPFYDTSRGPVNAVAVGSDAVLTTDGAGGLVHVQGGDVFVADATATRRLTAGELLAIGPSAALARECSDDGTCGNVRIDADGGRTPLVGSAGAAIPPSTWFATGGTMSPDGRMALIHIDPAATNDGSTFAGSDWAFLDTETGTLLPAPEPDRDQLIHWSEDSRHAFYLADEVIHVVDRDRRALVRLVELGEFDAITTVPLDFDG